MSGEAFHYSGTAAHPSVRLHLGWVTPRGGFSDGMPFADPAGSLFLFFHGEEFASDSTRNALRKNGYAGRSDRADYLLHLYRSRGGAFLTELNGWFSGLLLDLEQERILLFNDRYGMQRLYLHDDGEALYFASEAKCLLRVFPHLRELDPEGLAEYVSFGCVFAPRTLFSGISLLPAGSCWTFDAGGRCRQERYFDPAEWESSSLLEEEALCDRLRQTILNVVPRYGEPEQEVGLSLTGGLDTRLMVAALQKRGLRPKSYTFGGRRDTLDIRQSRKVARETGLDYEVLRLDREFFRDFPDLVEQTVSISDGTLGASGAHNLYFNRLARQVAPIRLTGKFGSEVLRQGRILPGSDGAVDFLSADFRELLGAARRRAEGHRQGHPLTQALFRDIPWLQHGVVAIEQSQLTLRSPFMDNELVELMYAASNSVRQSKRLQLRLIHGLNPQLARIFTDRGDARGRNALVTGFCRVFLWTLFKLDYLYYFDTPRWMARGEGPARVLGLPQVTTGHQKFEHYRVWYRGPLADYVTGVLLAPGTLQQPFFDAAGLRRIVEEHLTGRANQQAQIAKALSLESVARVLLSPASDGPQAEGIRSFTEMKQGSGRR